MDENGWDVVGVIGVVGGCDGDVCGECCVEMGDGVGGKMGLVVEGD